MGDLGMYIHFATPLRNLTKMTIALPRMQGERPIIDLDDLKWITRLPKLKTMEFDEFQQDACIRPEETTFNITKLIVRGPAVADEAVLELVNACPRLVDLSLELVETEEVQGLVQFGPILNRLPATLERLSLKFQQRSEVLHPPIDDYLPRFSQLRHIELDGDIYTARIDRALSRLPLLETITLDGHEIDVKGLGLLVEGPRRLSHLRIITLGEYKAVKFAWDVGNYRPEEGIDPTGDGLDSLSEACQRQGVTIEGLDSLKRSLDRLLVTIVSNPEDFIAWKSDWIRSLAPQLFLPGMPLDSSLPPPPLDDAVRLGAKYYPEDFKDGYPKPTFPPLSSYRNVLPDPDSSRATYPTYVEPSDYDYEDLY
jgi:hypothetical protein